MLRVAAIDSISLQEKTPKGSKTQARLIVYLASQTEPLVFQGAEAKSYYTKIKRELVTQL